MEWGRKTEALLREIERDAREGDDARLLELQRFLFALPSKDLRTLDLHTRWTPYHYTVMVEAPDPWIGVVLAEPTGVRATVASWRRNGHLRERATRELARLGSPLAARALGLRTMDPVPQVRLAASEGVVSQLHELLLPEVIDVIRSAGPYSGGAAVLTWIEQWLDDSRRTEAVVMNALGSHRRGARRWAVERGVRGNFLAREQLLAIALGDGDQFLPPVAAAPLLEANPAEAVALLRSSDTAVRCLALGAMPGTGISAAEWDRLLADRSTRVRALARERAARLGVDVSHLDESRLRDGATPRDLIAALGAVTARSMQAVQDLLPGYLDHPTPRVRAACAQAIARSWPVAESRPLLRRLLGDVSYRVARVAAVALADARTDPSIADEWWHEGSPKTRRAVWLFWSRLGGWSALVGHLRALAEGNSEAAGRGKRGLEAWLRDTAPRLWVAPTATQRSLVLQYLANAAVGDAQRRQIEFALRTSST